MSWIFETTSRIFAVQKPWGSHCRWRIYFDDTLQLGAQVYSDATSDENSGCKSCRRQGMEETRDNSSTGFGKVKSKKDVILEAHRDKRKVHLLHSDGHMSPQKCRVGTPIAEEVQRQSRAPGRQCKGRLWSQRSLHWTRRVSFANDRCKNNGRYFKITRLWWTSSWCSTRVHR